VTYVPVQRHFTCERIGWTARRQVRPPAIRFRSAFGEVRLLRLEDALTEEQLASASEKQLHDWLRRSQRHATD
jgi:hypothetical protein